MLKEFKSYLSTEKHVKDKYVSYYLKWVSDCCGYFNVYPPHRQEAGIFEISVKES